MNRFVVITLLAGGCNILDELLGEEPNCSPRKAFYPDDDGDGLGDAGTVYIGCEAPPGWVEIPPPIDADDTDAEDTDPGDTDPVDSDPADTDPADTDPVDSDPVDTDPVDTDPVDTDTDAPGAP
jgi:hypothetical protein